MAKEVITKLVDDLDGGAADQTVEFGLDGASYEIDLSNRNAAKLRVALASYIEAAAKLPAAKRTVGRRAPGRPGPKKTVTAEVADNATIRVWAARNGFDVAERGRVPANVVEQFNAARGR